MIRSKMTDALIAKSHNRAEAERLAAEFIANGGKVKRIACTGKTPFTGNRHYCDPRDRGMLNRAMVTSAARGVGLRGSVGQSTLIRK